MVKNALLRSELLRWFDGQKHFVNRKEVARATGIPYETLRKYFIGLKSPGPENVRRLSDLTGLDLSTICRGTKLGRATPSQEDLKRLTYIGLLFEDLQLELARCLAGLVPAKAALNRQVKDGKIGRAKSAQAVQSLMDALQRSLEPFLEDAEALDILRRTISGSDAGFLSGLLGAIFDDRRLQIWREMTTYRYGSK